MNPAQFQNMGAMGGGMPNPMQQQQMRANPNLTSQQIQRIILQSLTAHTQSLQAQEKYVSWHGTVQLEQRAAQVKLLIDSLRLIQPVVAYDQAIHVALTFEQKAFSQEVSREKYIATIKEKLSRIQDTRASQVQNQGNNLQQMTRPGQNMNFNPQFQQMQPSPMMPQGMPQVQQNLNPGMPGQPVMMQQNMQQRGSMQNKSNFSEDDNKAINQMAAAMAKRMSPEDISKIRESLSDDQKQQMAQRNVDPLAYYFRTQAAKAFSQRKNAAQTQNSQINVPQAQQQMGHNFGVQPSGSPYAASINQIHGQQVDGMRSQEVGELVVPASNAQGLSPEQFQVRDAMIQNQQRQANGTPNSMLAQQQNQQNRQAQAQAQSRAQAAARAAQLGLHGQGQHIPAQSTTPLSQGSRASGPVPQGLSRPPSRTPQQSQPGQLGSQQQQPNQGAPNALARFPPELQAILRQKPPGEWKATAQAYMAQKGRVPMGRTLSQQPGNMPMQTNGPVHQLPNGQYLGGSTMQHSLSSGAMPAQPQMPRSQPENAQHMLQQQQQQRQLQQNQELARQRQLQIGQIHAQQMANQQQQLQLQQQLGNPQQQQGKNPGPPLTPQQMVYMDQQEAHVTIAQNLQQHAQWSPLIKTWGQLKQWLQRYPISTLPITRIEEVQRIQFSNIMQARQKALHQQQQQQQQLLQQQAAGMPMGQVGIQNQPSQQQIMQQGRPNMPQRPNPGIPNNMMTQVMPVTPEDIANARRVNQNFQEFPDDRIAAILRNQRMKAVQNRLNEQGLRQEPVFMPVQTGQPQVQQPGTRMARQPSSSGSRPVPPQSTAQRQQASKASQAQPQAGPVQAPSKNLKRQNEIENSQASQGTPQGNRPQQTQAPGSIPNISREQFEKLPPAQQQRFMAMKRMEQRNREASQAIVQLTKELQSGMQQRKGIANMSAANKARATRLLTQDQTKNMLGRFDPFIVQFLSLSNDRETTKQLLSLRMQLVPQYKLQSYMNKTYEVADQFSMTADQIEKALMEMFQKFQMTLQKSTQMRQQSQGGQMQGQATTQQLTPGNLERLEQEQQEAQRRNSKSSKGKDVPPAPTTSQAPFNFGDPRGQGTPKYASAGLKQEDLKLDPKRRKRNPPTGAMPATPNAVSGVKASSGIKAEPGRKMEPELPFKCSIVNCEYQSQGFATQPELDMHSTTAHRPTEETVEDPIAFFTENMHRGLGLDENSLDSRKMNLTQPRSLPMQKTASTASAGIKAEVMSKPGTPLAQVTSTIAARSAVADANPWSNAQVQPELLHDVFGGPDPFATDFDLEDFVGVYKQSDKWKGLPRANPKAGFSADWKEPVELREARERQREARLAEMASGDVKSPADVAENDLLVDLKIEGLDIESDPDWEAIEKMNLDMDFDMDMGSPWENLSSVEEPASTADQIMSADDLMKVPWDDILNGSAGWLGQDTKLADDDACSYASYESLDWEAMFANEDNIVAGSNGMQAKRTIIKKKGTKM